MTKQLSTIFISLCLAAPLAMTGCEKPSDTAAAEGTNKAPTKKGEVEADPKADPETTKKPGDTPTDVKAGDGAAKPGDAKPEADKDGEAKPEAGKDGEAKPEAAPAADAAPSPK